MADKLVDTLPYKEVDGEKIFFRGTYRIVGQIVNTLKDIRTIGYLIMDEKNGGIKMFDVAQTLFLIRKFKFVNAEESKKEPGVIRCTEGKMENIMKFNSQGQRLSEPKIMILGEVVPKKVNEEREFKILNYDLQVLPRFFKESEVIELVSIYPFKGIDSISNAKKSANNTIIANVSHDIDRPEEDIGFPKILKKDLGKIKKFESKQSKADEWRKQKHREKLVRLAPVVLLRALFDNRLSSRMVNTHIRYPEQKHHVKDDLYIIIKEIMNKEIKESEVKAALKERSVVIPTIQSESYLSMADFQKYISIYQYMLYIPSIRKEVLRRGKEYLEYNIRWKTSVVNSYSIYNKLKEENVVCKPYKEVVKELEKYLEELQIAKENKKKSKSSAKVFTYEEAKKALRVLPSNSFKTAKEIAELGFAVQEKYGGNKYITSYGSHLTLKYIGNSIPNYEKYYKMASSFGDLACLAQIENIIENKLDYSVMAQKKMIEIIMGILTIYRPDIAKVYMKDRIQKIDWLKDILPEVDFDEFVDYGLDERLKVYYDSGFNAFYMDDVLFGKDVYQRYTGKSSYRDYIRRFYTIDKQFNSYVAKEKKEPLINFRNKFGGDYVIQHKLFTELIAVLGLITSSDCTTEDIEKYIGNLRNM